jgi:hypothetical protein
MLGTVLLFRDDGPRPHCEIVLGNGDRIQLVLDAQGLAVDQSLPAARTLFRAPPKLVAQICAGLIGPKAQSDATPLRILAAVVQRIGSADDVRAAFADVADSLGG